MILTAVQKTCKWSLACQQMLTEAHRGPSGVFRDLLASFIAPSCFFIFWFIFNLQQISHLYRYQSPGRLHPQTKRFSVTLFPFSLLFSQFCNSILVSELQPFLRTDLFTSSANPFSETYTKFEGQFMFSFSCNSSSRIKIESNKYCLINLDCKSIDT